MKWDKISAKERDKLVQVNMGGLQCHGKVVRIAESDGWECLKCGIWWDDAPEQHEMPGHCIPSYSTDMNAAMSVLEKFGIWDLAKRGDGYMCAIGSNPKTATISETRQEAICRAVLKVCDVDIE